MERAEAQRRADEARTLQQAINFHNQHNAEHLALIKEGAAKKGLGVWVTLTRSGNLLIKSTPDLGPGELEWKSMVADDE